MDNFPVYQTALFLHILGAFILTGGIIAAGVAFEAARRRSSADEIALRVSAWRASSGSLPPVPGSTPLTRDSSTAMTS